MTSTACSHLLSLVLTYMVPRVASVHWHHIDEADLVCGFRQLTILALLATCCRRKDVACIAGRELDNVSIEDSWCRTAWNTGLRAAASCYGALPVKFKAGSYG
jgi:hypothetical protein